MGYYQLSKSASLGGGYSRVGFTVLEKSLGHWHRGHSRMNPEIHVEMIFQVSRNRGSGQSGLARRILQRMRGWLAILATFLIWPPFK